MAEDAKDVAVTIESTPIDPVSLEVVTKAKKPRYRDMYACPLYSIVALLVVLLAVTCALLGLEAFRFHESDGNFWDTFPGSKFARTSHSDGFAMLFTSNGTNKFDLQRRTRSNVGHNREGFADKPRAIIAFAKTSEGVPFIMYNTMVRAAGPDGDMGNAFGLASMGDSADIDGGGFKWFQVEGAQQIRLETLVPKLVPRNSNWSAFLERTNGRNYRICDTALSPSLLNGVDDSYVYVDVVDCLEPEAGNIAKHPGTKEHGLISFQKPRVYPRNLGVEMVYDNWLDDDHGEEEEDDVYGKDGHRYATYRFEVAMLPDLEISKFESRGPDPRIGYFINKDIDGMDDGMIVGNTVGEYNFLEQQPKMINRWLATGDPADCSPHCLVFHLDPSIPPQSRLMYKKAVEWWRPAFEAIGIPDTPSAVAPGDPEWPDDYALGDIRYPALTMADVGETASIASWVNDPRTGQILFASMVMASPAFDNVYAHVMQLGMDKGAGGFPDPTITRRLDEAMDEDSAEVLKMLHMGLALVQHQETHSKRSHGMVPRSPRRRLRSDAVSGRNLATKIRTGTTRRFFGRGEENDAHGERVLRTDVKGKRNGHTHSRPGQCHHASRTLSRNLLGLATAFAHRHLSARQRRRLQKAYPNLPTGLPENPAPTGPEFRMEVENAVTQVIAHEIGHMLGLRHNFAGSLHYTLDQLSNKDLLQTSASIMDYNGPNIATTAAKQGRYFSAAIGPYDMLAIKYGYSKNVGPLELNSIANELHTQGLKFATDESSSPFLADEGRVEFLNAEAQTDDLSSDIIGYSLQMTENALSLVSVMNAFFEMENNTPNPLFRLWLGPMLKKIGDDIYGARQKILPFVGGWRSHADATTNVAAPPISMISTLEQIRALHALETMTYKSMPYIPSISSAVGHTYSQSEYVVKPVSFYYSIPDHDVAHLDANVTAETCKDLEPKFKNLASQKIVAVINQTAITFLQIAFGADLADLPSISNPSWPPRFRDDNFLIAIQTCIEHFMCAAQNSEDHPIMAQIFDGVWQPVKEQLVDAVDATSVDNLAPYEAEAIMDVLDSPRCPPRRQ